MAMLIVAVGGAANQGSMILISWAAALLTITLAVIGPPNEKEATIASCHGDRSSRVRSIRGRVASFWLVAWADCRGCDHFAANRLRTLQTGARSADAKG